MGGAPAGGTIGLETLLFEDRVVCHPCIIGELACGALQNRSEIISLLKSLPRALEAEHEEVLQFIDTFRLMGLGLGYIDIHLLAAAKLTGVPLWTIDQRLHEAAIKLGIAT